jgi:TPR repeat protein
MTKPLRYMVFEAGLGRPVDLQLAESWYLRGIEAGDVYAHSALAYMLLRKGEDERALRWFSSATKFGGAQSYNDLAWLLATSKITELRNGELSLQHALKAVDLAASAAYLDTLAAAYAESGLFADALLTQEQAIAAAFAEDEGVKQELELHLLSYQKQQPWRE